MDLFLDSLFCYIYLFSLLSLIPHCCAFYSFILSLEALYEVRVKVPQPCCSLTKCVSYCSASQSFQGWFRSVLDMHSVSLGFLFLYRMRAPISPALYSFSHMLWTSKASFPGLMAREGFSWNFNFLLCM